MSTVSPDLSLDLSPPSISHPISRFFSDFSIIGNCNFDKLSNLSELIARLEDELRKIEAFKRELPLSVLLLSDAIAKLKEEGSKCEEEEEKCQKEEKGRAKWESENESEMKSWMSSAQLWNPTHQTSFQPPLNSMVKPIDRMAVEATGQPCKYRDERGAFLSFEEDSSTVSKGDAVPSLSLVTPGLVTLSSTEPVSDRPATGSTGMGFASSAQSTGTKDQGRSQQPPYQTIARKQRRCWSPELHRRFIDALERLGGSQVATPKQIRELMQVDGLTNDEVKSHLQKYRLHARKLPRTSTTKSTTGHDKLDSTQLGSPEGPLHLDLSSKCNSTSMEEDDEENSDGYSWKSHHHRP